MTPCNLCLWQRKPLIIIVVLSIVSLILWRINKHIIYFIIILIIVNIIISFYHIGVENGLFSVPTSCKDAIIAVDNVEELENIIKKTSAVRCDKPTYIIGKISMSLANFIYSILFLVFVLINLPKRTLKKL